MTKEPKYIIQTSRWGWNHSSEFRLAYSDDNVKNIVRGLLARYGTGLVIKVYAITEISDETSYFVPWVSE